MIRDLITLPVRIGTDATRLGLRVAGEAFTLGWNATERLVEVVVPRPGGPPVSSDAAEAPDGSRIDVVVAPPLSRAEEAPPEPAPSAPAEPFPPPWEAETVPPPAPAHVSEEPQLVEEFAEPGAEDGVGAAVHVEEPWEGYGQLTADQVVARMAAASREVLAAVALYEGAHRGRKTVLAAAHRRLRLLTAEARENT
jgi:hypothetical protein